MGRGSRPGGGESLRIGAADPTPCEAQALNLTALAFLDGRPCGDSEFRDRAVGPMHQASSRRGEGRPRPDRVDLTGLATEDPADA